MLHPSSRSYDSHRVLGDLPQPSSRFYSKSPLQPSDCLPPWLRCSWEGSEPLLCFSRASCGM